ncbi:cupin domain-containing protein [Halorarius halobius]|uniref:cupin domain-containing protein n=1 Tax=Halorarius halobius TaxID=2962671 RepID=UPI0020CD0CD8|nr:cupin domain-containing protein [Halorarius halobius]
MADHAVVLPDSEMVTSPPSGKTVRFLERPDDPDSDPLTFEMTLAPDGHGPMRHVHPEQDEWLEVQEGRLGVWVEGRTEELEPGERVTIPAGTPHRFWNAGRGELRLHGGVAPGLRTEQFMRVTYGLARDGAPITPSGMPLNVLRLAVLLSTYDDMLYLSALPVWLQRAAVRLLAPLGRAVGYDDRYVEYLPP